jgi:hypothetical protein
MKLTVKEIIATRGYTEGSESQLLEKVGNDWCCVFGINMN